MLYNSKKKCNFARQNSRPVCRVSRKAMRKVRATQSITPVNGRQAEGASPNVWSPL